jgi:hypothetical protein
MSEVSGAFGRSLENPRERFIRTPRRLYSVTLATWRAGIGGRLEVGSTGLRVAMLTERPHQARPRYGNRSGGSGDQVV